MVLNLDWLYKVISFDIKLNKNFLINRHLSRNLVKWNGIYLQRKTATHICTTKDIFRLQDDSISSQCFSSKNDGSNMMKITYSVNHI